MSLQPLYGSLARIAVIVPSPNAVLEPDIVSLLPHGVSAHFARVGSDTVLSLALLEAMADELAHESRKLALCAPSAIGYGCTAGSFFQGSDFDQRMARRISEASGGIPATTATLAAVAELRRLDVSAISFCTPYFEGMHVRGIEYFNRQGFRVTGQAFLGLSEEADIQGLTSEEIKDLVRLGDSSESEAIFVSCTGLRILPHLADLELELGKPVLSSNLTLTRHLLRLTGLPELA